LDINGSFPIVAKGRLVNFVMVRTMDGHLLRWTEGIVSERTVEMIIEHNVVE
jgi:hypothetical protein